jgi:glutathione peroxidase
LFFFLILVKGNNFYQEPGTNEEVEEFARSKGALFPIMSKVDCGNSPQSHPLFPFLTSKLPGSGLVTGILGSGIKWNFTKFLCDENGVPVKRFSPGENPASFENDIVEMLHSSKK